MKIASMVLAGVLLAGSVQAQQINACYNKKTGALRISNQCKKTEAPISWGGQGERGVQGEPGYSGPSVLDATGQTIGMMATLSPSIFIPSLGAFVTIDDKGQTGDRGSLMFETEDCSGPGYLLYDESELLWNYKKIFEYLGKYYIGTNEVTTRTIASHYGYYSPYGNQKGLQCLRLCGYYRPRCPNWMSCGDPDYMLIWLNMNEDCRNYYQDFYDPTYPGKWTTIDKQVTSVQEVTLPFKEPLALPLSFR